MLEQNEKLLEHFTLFLKGLEASLEDKNRIQQELSDWQSEAPNREQEVAELVAVHRDDPNLEYHTYELVDRWEEQQRHLQYRHSVAKEKVVEQVFARRIISNMIHSVFPQMGDE